MSVLRSCCPLSRIILEVRLERIHARLQALINAYWRLAHCSVLTLCSAKARSDANFQGFGMTSAKIKSAQGNRLSGFSVIDFEH